MPQCWPTCIFTLKLATASSANGVLDWTCEVSRVIKVASKGGNATSNVWLCVCDLDSLSARACSSLKLRPVARVIFSSTPTPANVPPTVVSDLRRDVEVGAMRERDAARLLEGDASPSARSGRARSCLSGRTGRHGPTAPCSPVGRSWSCRS